MLIMFLHLAILCFQHHFRILIHALALTRLYVHQCYFCQACYVLHVTLQLLVEHVSVCTVPPV